MACSRFCRSTQLFLRLTAEKYLGKSQNVSKRERGQTATTSMSVRKMCFAHGRMTIQPEPHSRYSEKVNTLRFRNWRNRLGGRRGGIARPAWNWRTRLFSVCRVRHGGLSLYSWRTSCGYWRCLAAKYETALTRRRWPLLQPARAVGILNGVFAARRCGGLTGAVRSVAAMRRILESLTDYRARGLRPQVGVEHSGACGRRTARRSFRAERAVGRTTRADECRWLHGAGLAEIYDKVVLPGPDRFGKAKQRR